jgi:hypothetical protein
MGSTRKPSDNGNPSRFSVQAADRIRNRTKDNNDHDKATARLTMRRQPGVRKQKIFLVIDINNESVKPATIAIISAIYFAELRLNLSTTIMETT